MSDSSSVATDEAKPVARKASEQQTLRARRLAITLVLVALGIYFGFIMMMAWR